MSAPPIELGMKVWARDGLLIGMVGRIWYSDGSITPPLPGTNGTPGIVAGIWAVNPDDGLLQVSRFVAPDWFIPFAHISAVRDGDVHLAFTEKQGQERGWRRRPSSIDMVCASEVSSTHPARSIIKGGTILEPRPDRHRSQPAARIDPQLAAIILEDEVDMWEANVRRSRHHMAPIR